jgi:hypothetical protein
MVSLYVASFSIYEYPLTTNDSARDLRAVKIGLGLRSVAIRDMSTYLVSCCVQSLPATTRHPILTV